MRKYLIVFFLACFSLNAISQSITPAGPVTLCGGGSATLTASNGDSYQWLRNNTDIPNETNKTFVANQAGTYTVRITINGSQSISQAVVVTAPGNPTPSFPVPSGTVCAASVQLNGSASGGTAPYTYAWTFSDGGSSSLQTPVHNFANATGCGNTSVSATLLVTDDNGCTGTITRNIAVQQAPDIRLEDAINPFAPFSNCENNPTSANPNFTITVNNTSPSTCVTSYSLDWGDGSPVVTGLSKASFPLTHTYTTLGAFNMVLTGAGTNGCSNSKTYVIANQSNPDIGIGTTGITEGCADLPVSIKVSYWQANSPGTTYFLEYGDGNTKSMTHPINGTNTDETINYTYKTTSCETNGTPDYRLVISATNACRTKRFEGGNIVVKTKPKPGFSGSPACAGQQTCFTNETIAGYNNNCSVLTQYQWDFGDPASGGNNTSTAVNGCHTYANPGNYTVTLTTTNGCGSSTVTKTICVNASASPSFSLNDDDICIGSNVTATNSSTLGSCVSSGYQWSVNYASGFCGTTPDWNFAAGSTATSANPSFIFNNPGTYTITLSLTGACGSGVTQKIVTVKQKPVVTLDPIANACGQAVITPVATITSCTNTTPTYLWEFDGGASGTSASANPGPVTFNTPGLHTISLTVTNECGATTVTQQFSNNTGAVLTVPAPAIFCGGSNTGAFNFTTAPAGANVTWTNDHPEIGLAASGNGNIASFVATNNTGAAITATITVTATLNDCPDTKSFTIRVDPKPSTPVVTSPANYCHNDPANALTASVSPGHQLQWFTTATGGTGNTTLPTPNTSTVGTTTYYISQVNTTTGCESDRAVIIVNVSFIPVVTKSTPINPGNCATPTGQINLEGLNASTNYSVRYIKNGGAPTIVPLTSDGSGIISITGLTAGVYSDIVVINNGCVSNISGPHTLVDPNPPPAPTPGANVAICEGLSISLTASSAETGITWNWSGPNGFTSTQQNPVITSSLPIHSGNYAVTISKNNCTSPASQVTALVYPRPVPPTVNANTSACLKSDIQLQASTSFAGPVSWSWSGPNGFTSTGQNPVIPNATTAMAGAYFVTVTSNLGSCTSGQSTTNVSILPIPVITGSSHINPVGCSSATGSILLNGLLASSLYSISFIKDGVAQAPVNVMSAPDGTIIIGGLRAGTYTDLIVSFNGCSSDKAGPFTLEDTPPFSVIASTNGELCEGSTLLLTARVTSPGAAQYSWTGPNGFTSTQQNPVIPNAGTAQAGLYEVTVTINGCSGKSTVTAAIASNTIGGNTDADASVCPGQNNGIINLSAYHGRVLRWEASINNGQSWDPVVNTTASLNYNNITVTTWYRALVQSGVCASAYSDITIITVLAGVRNITMQPQLIETCNHDTAVTFSSTAVNDGAGPLKYYWYINGDVAGTNNPFTYNFTVPPANPSAEEFSVYVMAENNDGCNDRSLAGKVIVHALPFPQIQVNPSAIQREPKYTFTFTDVSPEVSADIYTWNMGDTSRLRSGREVAYDYKRTGTFKVQLYVEDKNTGCNARDSVEVTIIPVPGLLQIPNAFYPGSNHAELRTFKLKGTGIKKYRLQIFDAWGKVVFETTELNADGSPKVAWNGNYMNTGRPMPQDAYTWKIVELEFENGKPWSGMSYNGGPAKSFGNLTLFR